MDDYFHRGSTKKIKWYKSINMYVQTRAYICIHLKISIKEISIKPRLTARMLITYKVMSTGYQNEVNFDTALSYKDPIKNVFESLKEWDYASHPLKGKQTKGRSCDEVLKW